MKQLIRDLIWAWRVRRCWKQAEGDYGQFLSNIGFFRACGTLPHDILQRMGHDPDEQTIRRTQRT